MRKLILGIAVSFGLTFGLSAQDSHAGHDHDHGSHAQEIQKYLMMDMITVIMDTNTMAIQVTTMLMKHMDMTMMDMAMGITVSVVAIITKKALMM